MLSSPLKKTALTPGTASASVERVKNGLNKAVFNPVSPSPSCSRRQSGLFQWAVRARRKTTFKVLMRRRIGKLGRFLAKTSCFADSSCLKPLNVILRRLLKVGLSLFLMAAAVVFMMLPRIACIGKNYSITLPNGYTWHCVDLNISKINNRENRTVLGPGAIDLWGNDTWIYGSVLLSDGALRKFAINTKSDDILYADKLYLLMEKHNLNLDVWHNICMSEALPSSRTYNESKLQRLNDAMRTPYKSPNSPLKKTALTPGTASASVERVKNGLNKAVFNPVSPSPPCSRRQFGLFQRAANRGRCGSGRNTTGTRPWRPEMPSMRLEEPRTACFIRR